MLVNGVNGPKRGGAMFLLGWRVQASLVKDYQTKMGPGKTGVPGAEGQRKIGHQRGPTMLEMLDFRWEEL